MPRKPIRIDGRLFVRGKAECDCCEHKFKYFLPVDVLPFWDRMCSVCSLAMPDETPAPGQIIVEIIQPD